MTDREQIESAVRAFIAAFNEGNVEALMACYASDLIKLRQGAEPERKDETQRRLKAVFAEHRGRLEVQNEEIVVEGSMAYIRGRFRVELAPRAGGAGRIFTRRFLEIWRKDAGEWVVVRTADNFGESGS